MDAVMLSLMPRLWAGFGWACVVIGVSTLLPFVFIGWWLRGDLDAVALNLFVGLLSAIGFVLAGRWLIRNRKRPFS
jgi:hypothetical protein